VNARDFLHLRRRPWYNRRPMRHIRWVPLAFIAGTHGFALFAPYAALMLAVTHVVERRRRRA
jgi:hypothetical protein